MRSVLLFVLLSLAAAPAAAAPVILDDRAQPVSGSGRVAVLLDPTGELTIDDVTARPADFVEHPEPRARLGYVKGAAWVRLGIRNDSPQERWVVETGTALWDSAEIFVREATGWQRFLGGDQQPFAQRGAPYRAINLPLSIRPGEQRDVYLRLATPGTIFLDLRLWTVEGLALHAADELNVFGIFYGILFALALYNLFLFGALRDRSYLYYVLYLATYAVFYYGWDGLAFANFWPDSPEFYNQSIQFFSGLAALFALLFTRRFLSTPAFHRRLDRMIVFCIGLAAFQVALVFLHRGWSIRLNILVGIVMSVLIIAAGLLAWRRGFSPARYFLLAWTALALGNLFVDLKEWGVLPSMFLTDYGLRIGGAVEALLLSLALADRINVIRKEKEHAQAEALATEHRALENEQAMARSFARFVPLEFLQQLEIGSIIDVRLGDQVQREMTILFSDIRDFTQLSEQMTPKENFDFINGYLAHVGPVVREHGGFIDKYIGDAVMALFASPDDALEAAVGMVRARERFNAEQAARGTPPVRIGIGLHTGSLMLGVVGESERMEGTVIADAVNAASRLEGLTKSFGATLLISEELYRLLRHPDRYGVRYLGWAEVKGKARGMSVFEVLDAEPPEERAAKLAGRERFETAVAHFFAEEYATAAALFGEVLAENSRDAAAARFLERCPPLPPSAASI